MTERLTHGFDECLRKRDSAALRELCQHASPYEKEVVAMRVCDATPYSYSDDEAWALMLDVLLRQGVCPDARSATGSTLLGRTAATSDNFIGRLQLLVGLGAQVNPARERHEVSPLCSATAAGAHAATRFLLENGADVSAEDIDGSPLFWPILTADLELVDLLLAHGADAGVLRTEGGGNFLHVLLENLSTDPGRQARYSGLVHRLLTAGVDPTCANHAGQTALDLVRALPDLDQQAPFLELLARGSAQELDDATSPSSVKQSRRRI